MNNCRLITPEGTKDYLFEEAVLRKRVENKLSDVFLYRGYHEVVTPSIEFLDVFQGSATGVPIERMYKLVDAKGRLLVMRPDSTMPIARLCSTRLKKESLPLRLYYNQPVFSTNPSLKGRSDERMQTGIELIGSSSQRADIEVLVTAVKALQALKIRNFRIEVGHIGIFSSLVEALGVSVSQREAIRQLIEDKNYPALNDLLDGLENEEVASVIKMLPRLFGGEAVFRKARTCIRDHQTLLILDYLETLYHALGTLGLAEKITVDLGIVNRTDYYTGIVFKGYVEGYGEEVLSGGRYDSLLQEFGEDLAAIGFAVDVDAAVNALLHGGERVVSQTAVLVFAKEGYQVAALEYVEKLATVRMTSEYALCDTLEEALAYAAEKGIDRVDVISDEINTILR